MEEDAFKVLIDDKFTFVAIFSWQFPSFMDFNQPKGQLFQVCETAV